MITGKIYGAVLTIERLRAIPAKSRDRLTQTVQRLTFTLEKNVKADKLSGQVLNRRSGRLSRSVNSKFENTATGIYGIVGAYAPYAGVHEDGWDGTVRSHTRTSRLGNQFVVQAHHRHVPQRSYLRSALDEMRPRILTDISKAAGDAVRETLRP